MNIAFYILTYNRPLVLQHCLQSLYGNTRIRPDESWIIDDGSEPATQKQLLESCIKGGVNLMASTRNYGIGYSFERLYNLIWQNDDLDVACIIESDYVWRRGWLEDVCAVFEASPMTLAIAGTDHPDMYDRAKTHTTFPEIMREQFDRDLAAREHLYKPFDLETAVGKVKVQGVSNSCGCLMLHWKRFRETVVSLETKGLIKPYEYKKRMDRAFNKGITHDTRRNASDGHMSSIITMFGEMNLTSMIERGFTHDISKDFPMLSICDYSISEHICGGGVNGLIVPEGATFIHSPTWKMEYLTAYPRQIT